MSVLDRIVKAFTEPPGEILQTRDLASFEFTPLGEAVKAWRGKLNQPWKPASIKEALGVPAIQRAVSLISNTTGSLSVQGLRNGIPMDEPPRIIQRPDPFQTPREFYRDTAFCLATRGEAVWWIAARDSDGLPASLIVVPLHELNIDKNERDRRFPIYTWGKTVSTRFTPLANQTGDFVHLTYMKQPGDLRGKGPLQYCGVAISVTVEAQLWAANFFAGDPSTTELKSLVDIDADEANDLLEQWMERQRSNLPRVTNPTLEWVDHQVDPANAQMTEARSHQDGEAARMFGIPGKLLEYAAPGSSLTYQNIAEVFTDFVRSCLSINYLEPIEQAMSDLLPRTTAARFAVEGLLRADIKTRFEVYEKAIAVLGAQEGAQYARVGEGLASGNVEMQPTPYAFPAAVPASFPEESRAQYRMEQQEHKIDALLGAVAALATREQTAPQITVHQPPITVEPAQVTVHPADIHVAAPDMSYMEQLSLGVAELATREQPIPQVNITTPPMEISEGAVRVEVTSPDVTVQPPNVTFEAGAIQSPNVTVKPPNVTVNVPEQKPTRKTLKRDKDGQITTITEEPV